MSVRLYIRVPTAELQPETWDEVEWALFRPNGERVAAGVGSREQIETLLEQNGLRDVGLTLLVPAQTVVSCRAAIPARQARYIQQALPYAVEESIAQDIETMHLAASRKADKGVYNVLGVPRHAMEVWTAYAKSMEYDLRGIYPDALTLPYLDLHWSLCLEGDHALLRFGAQECLRMAKANLAQYMDLKIQRLNLEDASLQLRVFVHEDELEDNRVLLAELAQIENVRLQQEAIKISPFELLCESLQHQTDLINLCQGSFAVQSDRKSSLKRWVPALAIAATWFVVQLGIDLGTGYYYQHKADEFAAEARATYMNIFPNDRRVSDIRRSLEGKLRMAQSSGGGTTFLGLLSDAGYQLMQQPNRQAITLRSMNYNRQRGELSIDVQAGSFDQLDRYKQALAATGYKVEIGSAINEKNSVRSRMNISGGGS